MSRLLDLPPYGPRDDSRLLEELNQLTRHHLDGCPPYARIWPAFSVARRIEDLPFLHVGVFKHLEFKTVADGIRHERMLKSSATTSGVASRIQLDARSTELQSRSTEAILKDFVGNQTRPLLVLDSSKSLRRAGEVSARVAAALSLRPVASDITFLLDDAEDAASVNWSRAECALKEHDDLLVYGFTWILWLAWGAAAIPDSIRRLLAGKRIQFVHSGGWKKLEQLQIGHAQFEAALLKDLGAGSRVLDFYGLVEQAGVVYPLCEGGFRHVPVWAEMIVRDPYSLEALGPGVSGMLQLINPLAWGAPYHSVLTEDRGQWFEGACVCGRSGRRFELLGRLPKAEVRGCANV